MEILTRTIRSLIAGVVALVVAGVGVPDALSPYVWPSAILGLPAGIIANVSTTVLGYLWLSGRTERAETGEASSGTTILLWATGAATLAFVLVGGAVTFGLFTEAVGLATAMLVGGLPVGIVAAALAAYLVSRRIRARYPLGEPTPQ